MENDNEKDSLYFTASDWDRHYTKLRQLAEQSNGKISYSPQSAETTAMLFDWYATPGRNTGD